MNNIFKSLRGKFLMPTVLLAVVLLGVLGIIMALNSRSALKSSLDAKGNAVSDFITSFSAQYFSFYDFSDFDNIKKAVMSDPDVAYITIYNERGEAVTGQSAQAAQDENSSEYMIYERDIKDSSSGALLGRLKIGYKKSSLQKSIRQNAVIITVSILTAMVIFALGVGFMMNGFILNRIERTVHMLKDIAKGEGDLTRRLDTRGEDELADLAKWFNTFIGNIQRIVMTLQGSVEQILNSSNELARTADEMSSGSKEQASQTEQVASAMSEMTQTIDEVAANAKQAAEAAHKAYGVAESGRDTVDSTVSGMMRIAQSVTQAAQTIGNLGKSSSEIGNIISVIDEIADQTNLLALNAAIEAARAGEQGRGFAVVADEVRKLAERTSKATKEIASMIEGIQKDTVNSVKSMNSGSAEVQKGVDMAGQAKIALDNIVETSHMGEEMVQRIAAASTQQAKAAEDVAMNMDKILSVTHLSAQSTEQIKSTAEDLERLSHELKKMVGWFKV